MMRAVVEDKMSHLFVFYIFFSAFSSKESALESIVNSPLQKKKKVFFG